MTKAKKRVELEQQITEITGDLQRVRADFENYRKRVDAEKQAAREAGAMSSITKLLPVIDTVERAVSHIPDDLADQPWVKGVAGLGKQLTKVIDELHLERIVIVPGETVFDPAFHEAISAEGDGDTEYVSEELQPGYLLDGVVIRHAMVRVVHR